MDHADGCSYLDDRELLAACDDHEAECNLVESAMLEKMMQQVHRGGIPLTKRQRSWLTDLKRQLDGRLD